MIDGIHTYSYLNLFHSKGEIKFACAKDSSVKFGQTLQIIYFVFLSANGFSLSKTYVHVTRAVTTCGIISFQRVSLLQVSVSYLISPRYHYGMYTLCMYRKVAFPEISGTQVVFLREKK